MGLRTMLGLRKKRTPLPGWENQVLQDRAAASSAEFIEQHLETAILLDTRERFQRFTIDSVPRQGLLLEFGVFEGYSINHFARLLTARKDERLVYGFDAFRGLQENWNGAGYTMDIFNRDGVPPEVAENVRLVEGWIEDTLPNFLAENPGPIALLHIDTDTYTPAKTILSLCKSRLVPGSVIAFDDLLYHPGWQYGEYKALSEELPIGSYEWTAFARGGWHGLIRIKA